MLAGSSFLGNDGALNEGPRNNRACRILAPWNEGDQVAALVVHHCHQLPTLPSTSRDLECMGDTLMGPIMWMFPHVEHLKPPLSVFLWCVRLSGCLNRLPHSSHKNQLVQQMLACAEDEVSGHLCWEEPARLDFKVLMVTILEPEDLLGSNRDSSEGKGRSDP